MRCSAPGFLTERLQFTLPHNQIHANAGCQQCLMVAVSERMRQWCSLKPVTAPVCRDQQLTC